MSLKEFGKEVAKAGLLALILNPVVLLVLVILFAVFLAVGIGIIIYYGLVTAIILFLLSGMGILVFHYIKAVDLTKQPILAAVPFIMLCVGYFSEKLRLFAIQPLWITQTWATAQPNILLILILIIILAAAMGARRR